MTGKPEVVYLTDRTWSRGLQGQNRAHTLGVIGFALPAHVLLVQDDVLAGDPQRKPVPQHDHDLFISSLLDHCDSATEQCHAVTLFQGTLPLAADVILIACLD